MNDVLPCVDDLLELIWQIRRNNAGITCATNYMYHDEISAPVFYDNWVARDINGTALEKDLSSFRVGAEVPTSSSRSSPILLERDRDIGFETVLFTSSESNWPMIAVFDIIHPARRNLTAIRGYKRLGGLPDDPRTDPQDRSWFGPHDRLFTEEESEPLDFRPGPDYVWCWGWDGAGDLEGPDVDPIWERMSNRSSRPEAVLFYQLLSNLEEITKHRTGKTLKQYK
ncbi:hypothetical protein F5887DRAFT_921218 [Amanita rubescens]|nr:hypothetical protein F5887DRAFT_921218 [Amanita rubescens]